MRARFQLWFNLSTRPLLFVEFLEKVVSSSIFTPSLIYNNVLYIRSTMPFVMFQILHCAHSFLPRPVQEHSPVCVDHILNTKKIILRTLHATRVLGCITAVYG